MQVLAPHRPGRSPHARAFNSRPLTRSLPTPALDATRRCPAGEAAALQGRRRLGRPAGLARRGRRRAGRARARAAPAERAREGSPRRRASATPPGRAHGGLGRLGGRGGGRGRLWPRPRPGRRRPGLARRWGCSRERLRPSRAPEGRLARRPQEGSEWRLGARKNGVNADVVWCEWSTCRPPQWQERCFGSV